MGDRFASAAARQLAEELGVDPAFGSGRDGLVTIGDVRAAAATAPDPPGDLGDQGARLWHEVVGEELAFRPDELAVLGAACRTADQIAALEAELAEGPVMIAGSKGQLVLTPLVPELRQQRALLATLLARLDIPDAEGAEEGEWDDLSAAQRARKAARARWSRRAG